MAQTTGAITGAAAKIQIDVNATGTYTDISGSSQSVDAVEFTRLNGSAHTFDGDYAALTFGKQPPTEITVNILYTEVTGEAFLIAVAALKANHPVKLKWQPAGNAGKYFETPAGGKISSVSLPGNDAGSGEPLMVSFTVMAPGIITDIT
jgi:hypothetical protein